MAGRGVFRNIFQFVLKVCTNGYAAFAYASTPENALTSISQARANQAALASADARADKFCEGEGDLFLLADEQGNLIVTDENNVVITN